MAGRRARVRGVERHRRAAPGPARGRRGGGRRGRHLAVLVRGQRQRGPLRARAPGLRRHRRADAEPRSGRRGGGGDRAHDARCCPCTSSATRPTCPPSSAWACRSSRTPARRWARSTATACASARAGTRRPSASTPTSSSRPARAGWSPWATRRSRSASTPSATRAARPTWAGSTTTAWASTTASPTSPAPSASVQLRAPGRRCSPTARAWRAGTARRSRASRAWGCRARTPAASAAGWFVFVVQVPRGRDRDEVIHALRARGVQCKPYLPAIHLMSFYRERFGHREGEFPVCEDVAARSVALPFFPAMTEGQVATGGRGAGGGGRPGSIIRAMASLRADAERARRRRARRVGAVGFAGGRGAADRAVAPRDRRHRGRVPPRRAST